MDMQNLLDLYLKDCKANHYSDLSVDSYGRIIGKYIAFCEENGLNPEQTPSVAAWKIQTAENIKLQTVQTYLFVLSSFFTFCVDTLQAIAENPVVKSLLPSPKKIRSEKKPYGDKLLKEAEITDLFKSEKPKNMKKATAARNRAIVTVLMTSGLRNTELRSLIPSDLVFGSEDDAYIIVRSGKGDKYRRAPFCVDAQEAVREYLKSSERPEGLSDSDLLFGVGDTAEDWHEINRDNLSVMVKRYVANQTGHEGVRSHALRHAFASELLTNGVPIQDIQSTLGHSSIMTTEIYASMLLPQSSAASANSVFNRMRKER